MPPLSQILAQPRYFGPQLLGCGFIASVVGGVEIKEPAADLAVRAAHCCALQTVTHCCAHCRTLQHTAPYLTLRMKAGGGPGGARSVQQYPASTPLTDKGFHFLFTCSLIQIALSLACAY